MFFPDINGKSARSILEYLITGDSIDSVKYDEMFEKKVIARNLKASYTNSSGKQHGRSKADFNAITHFRILKREKMK